jgi:hypothetical protein
MIWVSIAVPVINIDIWMYRQIILDINPIGLFMVTNRSGTDMGVHSSAALFAFTNWGLYIIISYFQSYFIL